MPWTESQVGSRTFCAAALPPVQPDAQRQVSSWTRDHVQCSAVLILWWEDRVFFFFLELSRSMSLQSPWRRTELGSAGSQLQRASLWMEPTKAAALAERVSGVWPTCRLFSVV